MTSRTTIPRTIKAARMATLIPLPWPSFGEQAIADAGLGEQVLRARRVLLELAPEMRHVDAQVVRLALRVGPPHLAQELALRHDPSGVAHQRGQEPVLDRAQVHLRALQEDAPPLHVDLRIA